ncbi:beta-1,4-galactosyltransferase galt-1-like [Saccostrea echinata]|uniref:beta-1,4-galactosyltransferase galt-1-like n=1 Tax=Saccostrea echinata TaxID=191078 RepID=UPI002A826142|nr:beta-1,4-galactosyltransferase galt-1-like [Saccostrea echinata]XP_061177329.1 beta-1,4-galactosyltransferase galt-1-like [Saccostrea echinata]
MGRRGWPYRIYFLIMCMFYMLMVFVFHGQLQLEILQNKQIKGIVRHVHSALLKFNASSVEANGLRRDLSHFQVHSESFYRGPAGPLSDDCFISPKNMEYKFQTVLPNVLYIYSAYLDERTSQAYVRVMAILARKKKDKVEVTCHFGDEEGANISAVVYEMCENHNKMMGGYILSFPVDRGLKPCHVIIKAKESGSDEVRTVSVNVTKISPNSTQYSYGVCIPPLFGEVDKGRLVEFIELNQLLGAQHFIFYDFHISKNETRKLLQYYRERGLVTVIPWVIPGEIKESSLWYHGQLLAHNDCMFRAMSLFNFMVLQDIDEYVVPHTSHKLWSEALSDLFQDRVVGLSFHSAFFDPGDSKDLVTMKQFSRTAMYSKVRTKVMIMPSKIFEVGIHHVSKPLGEDLTIKTVDTKVANLHHYRKCVKNYGMKCDKFEDDKTMLKYSSVLKNRFIYIMNLTLI